MHRCLACQVKRSTEQVAWKAKHQALRDEEGLGEAHRYSESHCLQGIGASQHRRF